MNTDIRQAALPALPATTHECRFPGCSTLTLNDYCARHRPQGEWAIAEQVLDELHQEEGGDE